jgi:uncharacterized SAM-binding protein YcdF (DUF218 family)
MITVYTRRKWSWAAAAGITVLFAAVGLATLCILFTPLATWMSYPLQVKSSPATAEVIVVLGGGTARNGTLSDASLRRVWYGVRLYKEGCAPSLLFATGKTEGPISEARSWADAALVMGVPSEDIIV